MQTQKKVVNGTAELALRSLLFVPGNHPKKIAKVFSYGADAVIIDLEDACAVIDKPKARDTAIAALKKAHKGLGYIRINGIDTPFCFDDIKKIVGPWLDGIVLPKLEEPEQLYTLDWTLAQFEYQAGLKRGSIDIIPIIETGLGMTNLKSIFDKPSRVRRFAFGAGDFTRDVGLKWSSDETELAYVRSHMVLTSRACGLEPPIDTVHIQLDDLKSYEDSVETGVKFGFQGKLLIHPKQVGKANELYQPSPDELEKAKQVIAAFEESESHGSASIQVDGYFVDYPIVEKAYSVVSRAKLFSG